MALSNMSDMYFIDEVYLDASEIGYEFLSRERQFLIFRHKTKTSSITDLSAMVAYVKARMYVSGDPSDVLVASNDELHEELWHHCNEKKVAFDPTQRSWEYALIASHHRYLKQYENDYKLRFQRDPKTVPALVFNLGDNPENRYSWSAISNRLPTYRTGNTLYYFPHAGRWLTNREKLASMGFPIYDFVAAKYMVPRLMIEDRNEVGWMLGNAMHLASITTIVVCALASVSIKQDSSGS